jgi:hypothetical protein
MGHSGNPTAGSGKEGPMPSQNRTPVKRLPSKPANRKKDAGAAVAPQATPAVRGGGAAKPPRSGRAADAKQEGKEKLLQELRTTNYRPWTQEVRSRCGWRPLLRRARSCVAKRVSPGPPLRVPGVASAHPRGSPSCAHTAAESCLFTPGLPNHSRRHLRGTEAAPRSLAPPQM